MQQLLLILISVAHGLGVGILINVSWDRLTTPGKVLACITALLAIIISMVAARGYD